MEEIDNMLEIFNNRSSLMDRFNKSLEHMDNESRLNVLSSWMALSDLKECVEWQEEKQEG